MTKTLTRKNRGVVAICSPGRTEQRCDRLTSLRVIASYHGFLTAKFHGIGICWLTVATDASRPKRRTWQHVFGRVHPYSRTEFRRIWHICLMSYHQRGLTLVTATMKFGMTLSSRSIRNALTDLKHIAWTATAWPFSFGRRACPLNPPHPSGSPRPSATPPQQPCLRLLYAVLPKVSFQCAWGQGFLQRGAF